MEWIKYYLSDRAHAVCPYKWSIIYIYQFCMESPREAYWAHYYLYDFPMSMSHSRVLFFVDDAKIQVFVVNQTHLCYKNLLPHGVVTQYLILTPPRPWNNCILYFIMGPAPRLHHSKGLQNIGSVTMHF